jgi:hypothetical protein
MRQWARAPRLLFCGYCKNRQIQNGDPVLFITVGTMTRIMRRCVDCSGPAPPDLPALPEQKTPGDFSMTKIGSLKPKTRGAFRSVAEKYSPHNS